MARKNFIHINEAFKCEKCGKNNDELSRGCRNHCKYCLYSKHVDKEIPGDRKSNCKRLMEPVEVDHSGKKGYILIHVCTVCGKEIRNKVADDDNFDLLTKIAGSKQHQ